MSEIRLDNLEIKGLHLYQSEDNFNFGIDAVLLANFAIRELKAGAHVARPYEAGAYVARPCETGVGLKICDFCTGTLPIPLIMYGKINATMTNDTIGVSCVSPKIHIDAFEIDEEQVALCNKSISWNKENVPFAFSIDSDIKVHCDDIKNIFLDREKYKKMYESYDVVTVNPPYNKKGSGIINLNDKIIKARHEVSITFDDICKAASLILKSNKRFYFINQTSRFTELTETLRKYSLEMKKASFIHPYVDKESNLFLAEAVKNGRPGLKILPPIIIYEKPGVYTKDVLRIYGK